MQISGGMAFTGGITLIPEPAVGQAAYTVPGTYSWIAPILTVNVSVVAIGGGGSGGSSDVSEVAGGAGGGLGWKNNIPVVPYQT